MDTGKFKSKDVGTQKALDDVYRNALGIPLVANSTPTPDTMKPNVLTKFGTDFYIKTNDGVVLKLQGTAVV